MPKLPDNVHGLIKELQGFVAVINSPPGRYPRSHISGARAALAQLRRGVGKRPGEAPEALQYIAEYFPDNFPGEDAKWEREGLFLIATLFATHPTERGTRELAATPGDLFYRLGAPKPENARDAEKRRFVALLNCSPERLDFHLRQAVQLARSKEVPLDYSQWLADVLAWNSTEQREYVRMRWACAYWRPKQEGKSDPLDTDDSA